MSDTPLRSGCQPMAGREPAEPDLNSDEVRLACEDAKRVFVEVVGSRREREQQAEEQERERARSSFL